MNNLPDWSHLRAFQATAQSGSLSAAARLLGLTQPTVGRQIAALEDALGLMLFERVGRGLVLTDAGRELMQHAAAMAEAAERFALSVEAQRSEIAGPIRISASYVYAALLMPDLALKIKEAAPRLRPEIIASDDIADLMRREADIALRHVRPEEPDLVARLVQEATAHFYAAPSLLARQGHPRSKEALEQMDWISFGDDARLIAYMQDVGIKLDAKVLQASSENGITAWEMAKAGLGVCAMDAGIAALSPEMVPLMPDELAIRFPVWLVTHREVHSSPKIRLVFDMLADAFSNRSVR